MMSLQKTLAKDWPALFLLLLPFVLIAMYWNQIPEEIAMHWNSRGEIDRWGEKGFDVFFLPLISLGVYLLMIAIPYIDPKRKSENQQKGLRAFRLIIPLLLTGIFLVVLLQWIGVNFEVGKAIGLVITVFFLIIGNYLQSLRPNYFIGLRTPWTLESEDIWRKTHRLGSKVWVTCSLIMLVVWFFVSQDTFFDIFTAYVFTIALVPAGYSFYLYTKNKQSATEVQSTDSE